jgi:hypothetical protein
MSAQYNIQLEMILFTKDCHSKQEMEDTSSHDGYGLLLSRTNKHLLFGVIIGATGMWAVGVTILLFYLLGRK